MSFDIYGEQLAAGHCEVHPWVHMSFPCPVCVQESEQQYASQLPREGPELTLMEMLNFDMKEFLDAVAAVLLVWKSGDSKKQPEAITKLLKAFHGYIEHEARFSMLDAQTGLIKYLMERLDQTTTLFDSEPKSEEEWQRYVWHSLLEALYIVAPEVVRDKNPSWASKYLDKHPEQEKEDGPT